jgi:hypothetical protein
MNLLFLANMVFLWLKIALLSLKNVEYRISFPAFPTSFLC